MPLAEHDSKLLSVSKVANSMDMNDTSMYKWLARICILLETLCLIVCVLVFHLLEWQVKMLPSV